MTRQRGNKATYRVNFNHHYLVTLTRLKNTYCGQARFEANIINLDVTGEYIGTHVYRFTGHCASEEDEALFIVKYHEDKARKMREGRA